MPQLDFSTYPSQIFWLIVTFLFLYAFMARVIIPSISAVVESREAKLKGDIAAARTSQAEAEKLKNNLKNSRTEARSEARDIILESEKTMKSMFQKNSEEMAADLKKRMEVAEVEISAAKSNALKELASVSSELAIMISDAVASVKASKEQADEKVNQALKEAA